MRLLLAPALLCTPVACGGADAATSFGGMTQPNVTGVPGSSEGSGAAASTSGSNGDASTTTSASAGVSSGTTASTDEMTWDMGAPHDFGAVQPAGCQGKIDFLFLISSGGTMVNDQAKLLAAFPGFMDAIETQLPNFDVHILSANMDDAINTHDCSVCTDSCDPEGKPPFCGAKFTPCDKTMGAAVTFPTGPHASNRRCELDSGLRYITGEQHDLADTFACIAQVGIAGSTRVGDALVAALEPDINDPTDEDACNTGFLREDALLVVTIIQDVYDSYSLGTADEWIAALRAAKHGDDDAFAVLVLTTDIDVDYNGLCWPGEYHPDKNRLRLLAEGVEHGFIGSICQDSYAPFFAEHVAVLAELCDEFVPPG